MKRHRLALGVSIAVMALLLAQSAEANNLCLSASSVVLVGEHLAIPAKGTCKPWTGFVNSTPGNILTGVICTSSDGTKFFANQVTSIPLEILESTIALPEKTGTIFDCVDGKCGSAIPVAVVKCPKLTIESAVETAPALSSTLGQ
jgi:hypothetical protein